MQDFEELKRLQKIVPTSSLLRVETLEEVSAKGKTFPILSFCLGPNDPSLPTFGLFAGVHGLEKVGTHVSLHYLESLLEQLKWDKDLQKTFETMRLVSIPMINPVGVYFKTRSNGNDVDLMRNSPVLSKEKVPFLVGGHQFSKKLPWFRGDSTQMEKESIALIEFVKKQMFGSKFSMALDIHSGFGLKDRLWYPYAKTKIDFPLKSIALAFANLLQRVHPHHIYKIEAQSESYTTHGDLWDYMFDMQYAEHKQNIFIPWCLEMGSWTWIRKNPLQVFSSHGVFHPIKAHRYQRTMRRHYNLLDLFQRSCHNHLHWSTS
jgi:hypothetical protein